jgi:uncharacterized membrane protein YciS (DUF1049 family)
MLKRLIKIVILVPIAVVLIALCVANRQMVRISMDPFSTDAPTLFVHVPLFAAMFATLLIGVVLGGVGTWLKQSRNRKQLHIERREKRKWKEEARKEKERAPEPPASVNPATRFLSSRAA